jgi:hypothetical protein
MRTQIVLVPIATLLIVVGCANVPVVLPAASSQSQFEGAVYSGEENELDKPTPGVEQYRLFEQGATGFVSLASVRADVEDIASKYCTRKGKTLHPIKERLSKPPHILGNFPRAEIIFECVDSPPTAERGNVDRVSRLERLKKLLDDGALTKDEYEMEKARILGEKP